MFPVRTREQNSIILMQLCTLGRWSCASVQFLCSIWGCDGSRAWAGVGSPHS
jgi:hypothetical protein